MHWSRQGGLQEVIVLLVLSRLASVAPLAGTADQRGHPSSSSSSSGRGGANVRAVVTGTTTFDSRDGGRRLAAVAVTCI